MKYCSKETTLEMKQDIQQAQTLLNKTDPAEVT